MSADGKIADIKRSPARFSSATDKAHLEQKIAECDGVLFGAATLRAYGTTLSVSNPQLLQQRQQKSLPLQPIQIVASRSGNINPEIRFFRQHIPRWLLTTAVGSNRWQGQPEFFERVLVFENKNGSIDWADALEHLKNLGWQRLAVLGGGELVASMLAADLIDELWLTVCPITLGGASAPTPVAGAGFDESNAPRLELLSVQAIGSEVFLHYRLQRLERLDYAK